MFRNIVMVLFGGLASLTSAVAGRSSVTEPKTAVVIQAEPALNEPDKGTDITSSLALAMRRYADYYLQRMGQNARTLHMPSRSAREMYFEQLSASGYDKIILLRPQGILTERVVAATTARRVRYYQKPPGYLNLRISYEQFTLNKGTWTSIERGQVRQQARSLRADFHKSRGNDPRSSDWTYIPEPEPTEYVIERCLSDVLDGFFSKQGKAVRTFAEAIPTVILVDSTYIRKHKRDWQRRAGELLDLASWWFSRQFDCGFEMTYITPVSISSDTGLTVKQLYYRFLREFPVLSDTLVVAIGSFLDRFDDRVHEEIGLSEVGQRRILISELPRVPSLSELWRPFFDGLTLLHEIGHAFGALHVSDMNSVMSHHITWLAADQFDPVNRKIVQSALSSKLTFDDPAAYVRFVSEVLSESSYVLADYPAFFHHFLYYRTSRRTAKDVRMAVGRESYLWAAEAYDLLITGKKHKAADLLRRALKQDPHQASLYYYLSQAGNGHESTEALKKSSRLGYLQAQLRQQRLHTTSGASR